MLRQNVIRAEDGASPCRKRLSESRELPQECSADTKILFGSNQSSDAELDEAKHGQELEQKADETSRATLLISQSAGVLANDNSFKLGDRQPPPAWRLYGEQIVKFPTQSPECSSAQDIRAAK